MKFNKKRASAYFKEDNNIKDLINRFLENELNNSWAITRPFKKLYFNTIKNEDNLVKGIKNLVPAFIERKKDDLSEVLANNFSNKISNLPLAEKINLFNTYIKSHFNENANNELNRFSKNLFNKEVVKDALNNLSPTIQGKNIDLKKLFNDLNKGNFNSTENAEKFISQLDTPKFKDKANPIYSFILQSKIKDKLNEVDNTLFDKIKNVSSKTASIKRALDSYMPGGASDNAEAFKHGVSANAEAFKHGVSAGLLGDGTSVNYSVGNSTTGKPSTVNLPALGLSGMEEVNKALRSTGYPSMESSMIYGMNDSRLSDSEKKIMRTIEAYKQGVLYNPAEHNAKVLDETTNALDKRKPVKYKNTQKVIKLDKPKYTPLPEKQNSNTTNNNISNTTNNNTGGNLGILAD